MKRRNLVLLLFLMCYSNLSAIADSQPTTCNEDTNPASVVFQTVESNNLVVKVKFCEAKDIKPVGDNHAYYAGSITVTSLDGSLKQTFSLGGSSPLFGDVLTDSVHLLDVNFDGFPDIQILTWYGATGNRGAQYFLYLPAEKRFSEISQAQLETLGTLRLDRGKKQICEHSNGGHAGKIFSAACYIWKENKLQKVLEERQDYDEAEKVYRRETLEFKDGNLVSKRQSVVSPE